MPIWANLKPEVIRKFVDKLRLTAFFIASLFFVSCAQQEPSTDTKHGEAILASNFENPPSSVSPWVYWYWYADHISLEGIEKDLLAMKNTGIGTALIGNIYDSGSTGNVKALSDQWWDALRFAIKTAGKYDIDIGVFNSPGWSQSGGPWVSEEQSMRYLDSVESTVTGGRKAEVLLKTTDGLFQDVRVLAFRKLKGEEQRLDTSNTRVLADVNVNNVEYAIDGNFQNVMYFPESSLVENGSLQLHLTSSSPIAARSLQIFPHDAFISKCTFEIKDSEGKWKVHSDFEVQRPPKQLEAIGPEYDAPISISLPKTTASEFRLTFSQFSFHEYASRGDSKPGIKEIVISEAYKIDRYVEKKLAKVFPMPLPQFDDYLWDYSNEPDQAGLGLLEQQVVDVSQFLTGDTLTWDIPDGDWTIIRFGMRPTGTQNGPVSDEARGPEIDKLTKEVAYHHFDSYLGKLIDSIEPEHRTALKYAVVDSYEKGSQNWTDDFETVFKQTYAYDPIPFLPVYTGRVVNSVEHSERFLWDMRRLVADRVSYQYTAGLRERSHQHGLKLWLENYGHWGFPGEFLQYGGQADILSGEFWATGDLGSIELKAASSAAHIYGHNIVMSESFTSGPPNFVYHPWAFKIRGDWSFVEGINQTLLHVYIHQPYDEMRPGVNAWFGSAFNRNNTWFDKMGSWIDYLKRSNYMLQQGKYVADIMYFIGEDTPKMTGETNPALPAGYSYDYINSEVILNHLRVQNGEFVLADGMRFKLLVLPDVDTIRPAVLAKIAELVEMGGHIYGSKPQKSPSLEDFPNADQQVKLLANMLWQETDDMSKYSAIYGKGTVNNNQSLANVLSVIGTQKDVDNIPTNIIWTHRQSDTHDIYFVANQSDDVIEFTPSFRVMNKQPEYWNPVSGQRKLVAQFTALGNRMQVPLTLDVRQSVFIVFEKDLQVTNPITQIELDGRKVLLNPAKVGVQNSSYQLIVEAKSNGQYQVSYQDGQTEKFDIEDIPEPLDLSRNWVLNFEADRDVQDSISLPSLISISELEPLAMRHYSGDIKYTKEFDISSNMLTDDKQITLDLGEVGVIAQVKINGVSLGEFWSFPMLINITDAIRLGKNQLEIVVTNTWRNRLIGDKKYPESFPDAHNQKHFATETSTDIGIDGSEELMKSGLIGPVKLKVSKLVLLNE